ncbi:hypothetical protein [Streptomyces purpurascens]|uniref:hypothetical protein n=1 Tax=Streptomyces purpurascens TaxID=1924 RepID=UPI00167A2874|nr:hypothetical protein [Streptomyces purpurascens]MCE7050639.1 hypothetical protein [Streptomyces purpurascens]
MVGLRAWATRRRSSVLLVLDALGGVSWVALGLLLALVWGSFVGFVTRSEEEDRPGGAAMGPAPPTGRFSYAEEIERERRRLFDVTVLHTNPRALGLVADAPPRRFRVEIPGARVASGPGESQAVASAGTQMGVKLHCSGAGVRCTPLSSERQSVLSRRDVAVWLWEVQAERAGTFSVALTMTSYLRDTDTVLVEKPPLVWSVEAVAPPADDDWLSRARDLWRQVTEAITGLGGLAVSVSAIAAVIAMVIRRRLPAGGPDDDAGTADPVPDVGRRPRPRPVRRVRRVRRVRSRLGRAARRARQSSGSSTGAISS